MTTEIRGAVVRLLLSIDTSTVRVGPDLTPSTVAPALYQAYLAARHEDGRPLTEAEAALAATVTGPELDFTRMLIQLHSDAASAAQADFQRISELMKPYPRDMTIMGLLAKLPGDQQAELELLVDRVSGGDGHLARPEETVHFARYRQALAELDS